MTVYIRDFPNGRRAEIHSMTYGKQRIVLLSRLSPMILDDGW